MAVVRRCEARGRRPVALVRRCGKCACVRCADAIGVGASAYSVGAKEGHDNPATGSRKFGATQEAIHSHLPPKPPLEPLFSANKIDGTPPEFQNSSKTP